MNDNTENFHALGEALFEEIVVKAALDQPHHPGASEISLTLDFTVCVEASSRAVVIRCPRIGLPDLQLRLNMQ